MQCLEKTCRYQFAATTGTIFHDTHLPLQKWFPGDRPNLQCQEGTVSKTDAARLGSRLQDGMVSLPSHP